MRKLFKFVVMLLALTLIVAGGVSAYIYYQAKRTLPQLDGTTRVAGMLSSVHVIRDARGVPHVFAENDLDLTRATGFLHAQDRLFQMDLARRLGHGRMAEWFGEALVESDRRARRMRLSSAAQEELERLSDDSRAHLTAYAEGVNAFVQSRSERPLLEYRLLQLAPEPWSPVDTLAIAKWLAMVLSENASVEALRVRLAEEIGWQQAFLLTGRQPPDAPTPAMASDNPGDADRLVNSHPLESPASSAGAAAEHRVASIGAVRGASNAWVVAPSRTETGASLLASDPHLMLDMPSVWYLMQLSGETIQSVGATIPGIPFVILGRNQQIAWGMTASYADVQDYYLETTNPAAPEEYAVLDGWSRFEQIEETILVKDSGAVVELVERSRHGVMHPLRHPDGRRFALRWEAPFKGDHTLAALRMNQARSWQEFADALASWASPPLSFLYADVEGNIGFFPAGDIPVRVGYDGTYPVDGARGELDWQGSIPHELKPMRFNPAEGFIVSANHQMLPLDTAYPLGGDVLSPHRAQRIETLLTTSQRVGVGDMVRIQSDRFDGSSTRLLQHLLSIRADGGVHREAIDVLRQWDGQMGQGAAPAIYQSVYRHVIDAAFRDEMRDETYQAWLEYLEVGHLGGLATIIDDAESTIWDDRSSPARETREQILSKALTAALNELRLTQGTDLSQWDWGALHAVEFRHALGYQRPLDRLFDRRTTTFGGSTFTIANATTSLRNPYQTASGTSLRFVADLGSGQTIADLPTGQSGHPLSAHYFDQNQAWVNGVPTTIVTDRAQISATSSLELTP